MNIGISEHYRSISRGVIDTRDVLYYLSLIIIFLVLGKAVLTSRKA
jgi:ABC-2 type transport system permease protein